MHIQRQVMVLKMAHIRQRNPDHAIGVLLRQSYICLPKEESDDNAHEGHAIY